MQHEAEGQMQGVNEWPCGDYQGSEGTLAVNKKQLCNFILHLWYVIGAVCYCYLLWYFPDWGWTATDDTIAVEGGSQNLARATI
jgi:hypothetical protein